MVKNKHARDNKKTKNDLEEIRDIILGVEIEKWEKLINGLKHEIKSLHDRLSSLETKLDHSTEIATQNFEESKTGQNRTIKLIEEIKREFDKKIGELAETKVDRNQIGQAFIEWGTKVQQEAEK